MRVVSAIILLLSAATASHASPLVRVVNTAGPISVVDASVQSETTFSNTTFSTDSLAMAPGGSLFSANAAGALFNVTAPTPFYVGSIGYGQIGDLDYAPGGLWGFSNQNQTLFFYDFGASAVTYSMTDASLAGKNITGVAYRPTDGSVFLSGNTGNNTDQLFRVPAFASSASFVGNLAHGDGLSYVSDIDFDGAGNLYAMTWYNRYFYTVNPLNGSLGLVSTGPHRDVTGMALGSAVPEPASAVLLAVGLVGSVLRRKSNSSKHFTR